MLSATLQVRLEAGARHERTLEAVTCKRLLGRSFGSVVIFSEPFRH
jgi:hypothetical protein